MVCKKIILSIVTIALSIISLNAQQRPKSKPGVGKSDVVLGRPSTTNILANKSTLPEEDEFAWKDIIDQTASFKISFPGEPLRKMLVEFFNSRETIVTSYGLETKRAFYNFNYFKLPPSKGVKNLEEIYDSFDKEMFNRANPRTTGVTIEIISKKEFTVGENIGRETIVKDSDGKFAILRQFCIKDKFYYSLVSFASELPQTEKDILLAAITKFHNSVELMKK